MGIWRRHIDLHRYFDGMQAFYLNASLRSLAVSLISIFTPVFIYSEGLLLWGSSRYALAGVALFYLVFRLTALLSALPLSRVIEKIGFRRSVVVSMVFMILYLISLMFAPIYVWLLLLAPIFFGLSVPLYWVSRDSAICQDGNKANLGRQMSILIAGEQVAGLAGPFVAGVIITSLGYQFLYGVALSILMVSIVPLFSLPHHVHKNGASLRGFYLWLTNTRYFHQAVGVVGKTVDDYGLAIVWPLAIYLLGIKIGVIGGIFSLVALLAVLVRIIVGKLFDKLRTRGDFSDEILHSIAVIATSLIWMVRLFVSSVGGILGVDAAGSVFGTTYTNFYINYLHLGGMRMGNIAYWVYVEMTYSLTAVILMGVLVIAALFGIWREIIFLSAGLWVLVSVIQARESNLK